MAISKTTFLISAMVLLINILQLKGQTPARHPIDSLRLDESIRYGVLQNGLTYYIKNLKEINPKIYLNFLVKVGSNDELSNEINFAHHIEHLAFRESRNFPSGLKGNEKLLGELNMHYSDLGAKTHRRSTNYHFNLPAKQYHQALTTGLSWFKDIAVGLDLSKENIDEERGVLLQEFRSDEGGKIKNLATNAMYTKLFPCYNNYYEKFENHNKTFPHQDLKQFYKKWYQPNRMAVVIVGNIKNVEELELEIKNMFQDLRLPSGSGKFGSCEPKESENLADFVIVRRLSKPVPDNSHETFLFYKDPSALKEIDPWDRLLRNIQMKFITSILNERFRNSSRDSDTYFKSFSSYNTASQKPPYKFTIQMETRIGNEQSSLAKTIKLINQLKTFGITDKELELERSKKIGELISANLENSTYWLREINDHFVYGEDFPTGKNKYLIEWLEKVSKEDINKIVAEILSNTLGDIGLIYPEEGKNTWTSEEKIKNFVRKELLKPVTPYKIPEGVTNLLSPKEIASLPVANRIRSEEGKLESRKYVLENGLSLILKPTETKTNKLINVHGYSSHGASCFSKEEYFSTMFAPSIVGNAGIGTNSKNDLYSFFRNTNSLKTGASPYIKYNETGISAEVSQEELDKLLQLIFLYFTHPREDEVAFQNWKANQLKSTEYLVSPTNDLLDALKEVSKDYSSLPYASRKIEASQQVDMEIAYKNYRKLFADPANFTFILTGDYNKNEILPRLQKYLGNIPNTSEKVCFEEKRENDSSKGPRYFELETSQFYNTENALYGVRFVRKKSEEDDWKEELKIKILGLILDYSTFQLRSTEGFSLYQTGASGFYNRDMKRHEVVLWFDSQPAELPIVRKKTKDIIEDLKNGKISNELFTNQRDFIKSIYNPAVFNEPSIIIKRLYRHYRHGEPLPDSFEIEKFLQELEIEDIVETANKYLQEKYMFEVELQADGN